ncbi:50S ribosomal protein L35ae [Candidatus Woesearchaeota archaeon]|nr:50S ribosomal protein L35ae [Candidatus Woesearchaeota archaeon]
MEGVVVHYRQSRHTTDGNQVVVQPRGCDSRDEAEALLGKKVSWSTGKRDLTGVVAAVHGRNGAVRVVFDQGVPGQCLGKSVTIT